MEQFTLVITVKVILLSCLFGRNTCKFVVPWRYDKTRINCNGLLNLSNRQLFWLISTFLIQNNICFIKKTCVYTRSINRTLKIPEYVMILVKVILLSWLFGRNTCKFVVPWRFDKTRINCNGLLNLSNELEKKPNHIFFKETSIK
jgi:hypothetical protein